MFDHWHDLIGDNQFLGISFQFFIADISAQIHADPERYVADYIHLNPAGAELAGQAITDQINLCPEGRWLFGEDAWKLGAEFPKNPYAEYGIPI